MFHDCSVDEACSFLPRAWGLCDCFGPPQWNIDSESLQLGRLA